MIGSPRSRAALAGIAAALCLQALLLAFPRATTLRWRQSATDALLAATAGPPSGRVEIVRIDLASLEAVGPWPWPRDRLAALVDAIAAQSPVAIGLDLLLSQPGDDQSLRQALTQSPTALGFLLTDHPTDDPPKRPSLAILGPPPHFAPWQAPGLTLPRPALMQAAAGLGSLSLEVATDGAVRSVPLFVRAGPHLLPGFAVELVRLAASAGTYVLRPADGALQLGPLTLPLLPAARLVIRPTSPLDWPSRTISALTVLSGRLEPARLTGKVVLVGAGPPALGAFWRTPASAAAPSVQIQADAVETALSGHVPHRPAWAASAELAASALLALLAILAAIELAPAPAVAATALACLLYAAATAAALLRLDLVLDPVTPPLLGLATAAITGLVTVSQARRAASRLRNRFEQHLSPAIVARIAAQPSLARIAGERRDVTALFTDLEGFTSATERLGPTALVELLNRYFDIVVRIVIAHGGTVDKIIGDAVLAIFNAPADLPDHPTRAVRCALELSVRTQSFAAETDLGRTRIGIETGDALVGEIGGLGKLDYTAHGTGINTAARLEALNKQTGSAICVGPICRARITQIPFRSLGLHDISGRGPLEIFEPLSEPTPSPPPPAPSPIS